MINNNLMIKWTKSSYNHDTHSQSRFKFLLLECFQRTRPASSEAHVPLYYSRSTYPVYWDAQYNMKSWGRRLGHLKIWRKIKWERLWPSRPLQFYQFWQLTSFIENDFQNFKNILLSTNINLVVSYLLYFVYVLYLCNVMDHVML